MATATATATAIKYGPASTEARVVAGKPIERRRHRCQLTGDEYYSIHELPVARVNSTDPFPTLFSSARSPAEKYRQVAEVIGRHGQLDLRPADAYRDEIAQLVAENKVGQAAVIRLQFPAPVVAPDPLARFNPGDIIQISTTIYKILKMDNGELTGLVVRHCRGDYGVYGALDAEPLTDDHMWCPSMYAPVVANRAAIVDAAGGLVRSRYAIWRASDAPPVGYASRIPDAHAPARRQRDEWVEVMSLLSPTRGVSTLIYSCRDPVGAF